MPPDRLSPLQRELLEAFFRRPNPFFLTGGAALAGFHLGHRETGDLDLFATSNVLEEGERLLQDAATELGARVERVQTFQDFRRRLVVRGEESVLVDLVHDPVPQGHPEKMQFGNVRVDPPMEILANKLCALLSRGAVRDLVDVLCLDRAGFRVEDALDVALTKDGGATPGQLAWVLSQITIGEDARVPGGVSALGLRELLRELQERLVRRSFPG